MSDHGEQASPAPQGLADFAREAGAGISAAFVLVAMMLPLGLIAYAPLGEYAVEAGLRAALACAIFGNLTALVLGGALLPNEVPRASSVFLFAAFILRMAADAQLRASPTHGVAEILVLAAACLALTGIIQIAFGVLRLGNIARFVPYPVVAGLMTGLAISLVIYELPEILGMHGEGAPNAEAGGHHGINGWTLLVGLVTIVGFVFVRRRWPLLPSKLIGLAAGTVAAVVITALFHGDVGPRVPFLGRIPLPDALLPLISADGIALVLRFGYDLLITALAIGVVGSLDSLLAAVGEADGPLDTAHHPNRLLVALGCGNLVSSAFGGVPVAYSSHHALGTHQGGERKLVSSFTTTATLLLLLLYGAPLLQLIPVAALSAMMLVIAVGLIDRWAGTTIDRLRRGQYDSELMVNIALVVLVAGVTIVFGLVAAVLTGLILSMGLFLAVMNRSLIRAVRTGTTRGSRRVYPPEQASLLRVEGHRIRLLELDGAIFFGTADRLAFEALRAAEGAQFLIIDLRRVTMIDASGALMLHKLSRLLREQGVTLLLAYISATSRLGRAVQGAGVFTQRHHADWFDDADRALEWAERQLLVHAQAASVDHELEIGEFALMKGLSPDEMQFMKPYLDRQLFPARAALYHEGQLGDRLYLLARGAVSIVSEDPEAKGKHRRVVTLAPGVIFGESAIIEGGTRSVTAIAEDEVVTYSLSRRNLEAIYARNPDLYRRIVLNMLGHLSGLLRMASAILRDASESVE
ncbi:MAG: SLC26A/SulP transporter family protein [Burkholderiales bacterium]|nr:SLC26A/SulP transporter family protein [Burkholderiales bacterium]